MLVRRQIKRQMPTQRAANQRDRMGRSQRPAAKQLTQIANELRECRPSAALLLEVKIDPIAVSILRWRVVMIKNSPLRAVAQKPVNEHQRTGSLRGARAIHRS